jgi:hypothetical protein
MSPLKLKHCEQENIENIECLCWQVLTQWIGQHLGCALKLLVKPNNQLVCMYF